MLALSVCFPQPCLSAGRRFATSKKRLDYCRPIFSFPQNKFDEMLYKLDSTEYACSFELNPALPGGVGHFSNEHGFFVESSLQGIPFDLLLWKRHDSLAVI